MGNGIRLGISTCLLGKRVRYDGQHKLDHFLVDTLGRHIEFVPVCPEVECGLPVPREAMRLVGEPDSPRLLTHKTEIDHTARMQAWAEKRLVSLESEQLCGFIFKSNSPSSGMERVKVYGGTGMSRKVGVGIWARAFMDRFPLLPVEEEGRLHDPALRENFIERVFVFSRWRDWVKATPTRRALVDFHTRHKLLVMAHAPRDLTAMGRLVAGAGSGAATFETVGQTYCQSLMVALRHQATPRRNTNVLHHAMGYLKRALPPDEKQELLERISQYHDGLIPLVVPIVLLQHYIRKYAVSYLANQVYFNPHPVELQLRNHC